MTMPVSGISASWSVDAPSRLGVAPPCMTSSTAAAIGSSTSVSAASPSSGGSAARFFDTPYTVHDTAITSAK